MKLKKILAVVLTVVILLCTLPFVTFTASAATSGIENKIAEILKKYPTGSYFSSNGKACSHGQYETCSNCRLSSISSAASSVCGDANTCVAFAKYIYWYLFGVKPFTQSCKTATIDTINNVAKVGDYIEFYNSSGNYHDAIYLGPCSGGFYGYTSNYVQPNAVKYKSEYNYGKYLTSTYKVYHANNYDSINNTHTHDYYQGAEWDHPHRIYKKCACGDYYYTGATTNLETCTICYPFETPIVNIAQTEYEPNETIEISWNEIEKATHYKLVIMKKDFDGNYSKNIITADKLTNVTYLAESLSAGEYSINVYAYDNKNYNYSLDDWNYQKSEPIYFKICSFARYYDWTFDFDNAMKMMSDAMVSDGDLNLAFQEYNKGFIGTVDIYDEENIKHPEEPKRPGYKFTGWKILLVPNQSIYDVSYTHYIYQAQYEQLSYSKGECLYGDTNFDEKINVLDLIHLKRILIGTEENHICADLDADDKINAIDILMLKKFLLGSKVSRNIFFDANGGTVDETKRLVISGQTLGELPIPSRTGYDFTGWYTSDGTLLTSDTVMTTDSDITAIAKWSVKSYTYNIVYKSSNGTSLGTATAKYNFGTTNTISPKSFTGYTTPSSQSIKWDSTTAKTITFVYVPKSVPNSQNVKTGSWWYYDGEDRIIYSVNVEYQNRTSNSVQLRFVWTNTIDAYYRYGYTQTFYASANGVATGDVIICPNSEWSSSSSSARSKTAYSGWITVSITSTEEQTIKVLADYWDAFGKYSWGSYITIPAY